MDSRLGPVSDGREFVLLSGKKISSLPELYEILPKIDDTIFRHHVTAEKNDFSDWIRGVQKDYVLANSLNPLMSRESMVCAVAEHIYRVRKESESSDNSCHVSIMRDSGIDGLEVIVSDIRSEVSETLVIPEGGDDLVIFAEEVKPGRLFDRRMGQRISHKVRKVKDFVDLPGFGKDMKIVFGRKPKNNKKEIDDLKRVCVDDKE